jgi:hypothetical protein
MLAGRPALTPNRAMQHPGLSPPAGIGRFPRWRKFAAALGVLALLSQTFVLLAHRPPP